MPQDGGGGEAFDGDDWISRLLELNPWAANDVDLPAPTDWNETRGHSTGEAFLAARKSACEVRLLEGAEAWRQWAGGMADLRRELEEARRWKYDIRHVKQPDGRFISAQHADGAESALFLALSVADFRELSFEQDAPFEGWRFPGLTELCDASFAGAANFASAIFEMGADFQGVRFDGAAVFKSAKFLEWCGFEYARFAEAAVFESAEFSKKADFQYAKFAKHSGFRKAEIGGAFVFRSAEFSEPADFREISCAGKVDFLSAYFAQRSNFQSARIAGGVDLRNAVFDGPSVFEAAQILGGEAEFDNAQFNAAATFDRVEVEESAKFNDCRFDDRASFRAVQFKSRCEFKASRFSGVVVLREAEFGGGGDFSDVRFREHLDCRNATFSESAIFEEARLEAKSDFSNTTFGGIAKFEAAEFSGIAEFSNTKFERKGDFTGVVFERAVLFNNAELKAEMRFEQALFSRLTSFRKAVFGGAARFDGVYGKEGSTLDLNGAHFKEPPNFVQAHFQEAPRFDNVEVERSQNNGVSIWRLFMGKYVERDLVARWRNLKRLAIQGHDRQSELDFYAEEIKARRYVRDFPVPGRWDRNWKKPWRPLWPGVAHYWIGIAYQTFSSFGRSILLPLAWWAVSVVVFAGLYLSFHFHDGIETGSVSGATLTVEAKPPVDGVFEWAGEGFPELECVVGDSDPAFEALYLSAVRGLVFTGVAGRERTARTYACLYGVYGVVVDRLVLQEDATHILPLTVSYIGLAQLLVSVALLALFLLAIRSHFRIR